ncbi:MAG TPA: DUF58 domain-containing protein [Actinocrinis sp.]|nr:DUF58 domain-containing protein [Actinocrinis sp.]
MTDALARIKHVTVPPRASALVKRCADTGFGRLAATGWSLLRPRVAALRAVTFPGWSVLAGSLAAWLLAARLHWVEFAIAGLIGLITFVLCVVVAAGQVALEVTIDASPQRIEIGEQAQVVVTARNAAHRQLIRLPTLLEIPVGEGNAPRAVELPSLDRGTEHRVAPFPVHGQGRGVIPVGPATSVRGDPFGFVRRVVAWTDVREVVVHPERVPLPPLGSGMLHDLEGRTTEHISASDLEFHTLRGYVPTDDARHIHWRSSAKLAAAKPGAGLLVRQFLETRLTHLLVAVDGDPASYRGAEDFETAVSVGASVAQRALRDKLPLSLLVSRQLAHEPILPHALDACSRAQPAADAGISSLLSRGLRVAPRTTAVLVITGALPTHEQLRRACLRVPRQLRAVVVQVDPTQLTGVRTAGSLTVLGLNRLGELPVLIREGAAG